MTLKQLEAFYWAATCSSFAVAAARVHLSVSSLSKRLVELEQSLGQTLFDRGGRRATLTEAGARLLPLAGALLQQADRLRLEIAGAEALRGPCRIGVGELSALTWLPRLVKAVREGHPGLNVGVQVDIGEALTAGLDEGDLDVAVIAGPARRHTLVCTPLAQARFTWCASPALARTWATVDAQVLQRQALVALPPGSGVTPLLDDWLRQAGARPQQRLHCNHWGAIVGLLADGAGIGLLPVGWAQALQGRGVLQTLSSPFPVGTLDYGLHSRRDDLRPIVQALRDTITRVVDFDAASSVF